VDEEHDELTLFANKVIVPIGDLEDYGYAATYSKSKPFVLEKYMKINGVKYSSQEAIEIIKQNNGGLNVSEVYPGDLEFVMKSEAMTEPIEEEDDEVVGLRGNLGVRYGVQLSMLNSTSNKYVFTSVEIDVLDLKISQLPPLEGNSKLLLCLLNQLKDEEKFKLLTRYIFPMNKVLACTAIYNDLGFLPSIGEKTVDPDSSDIPGMQVSISSDLSVDYVNTVGWAPPLKRAGLFSPLILTWDEWDQITLRNSKSRIKQLFNQAYDSANADFGERLESNFGRTSSERSTLDVTPLKPQIKPLSVPQITKQGLLQNLLNPTFERVLPRFRRSSIVSNPFSADDKLCEK
jgi:hypothetical protein